MIKQNPFCVLGISPTATEREIQKQVTKTTRYAEVGKQISFDTDFSFTGSLKRDKESISIASSAIEQPLNRLLHSLFWFWNANHIDAAAFDNLSKDHTDKATEIWEKVVKDGDVSTKNLSCLFNLKSLYVAQSLKDNSIDSKLFIKGVLLAGKFFNHSELDCYTKQVVGEHVNVSSQELEIKYITSIYSIVKPFLKKKSGITTDDFLSSFATFSKKSREHISAKFTGDPIKKIEDQINTTSELREQNPIEALSFGETLYKNTKSQLESLSKILGKEDLKYQMLANKLANEILQCGIDYFNKLREEEQAEDEDGKKVLKLCKIAKKMVAGFESQTSARIDENYQIISDWVNDSSRELIAAFNKAMEVFESWDTADIKDTSNIRFNYAGDYHRVANENKNKPSLIYPAEELVKISKKYLPKLRKELKNEELLTFYNQIVQLVIAMAIKHANNHETRKDDIECCYLFHNTRNFPMSSETKKRHRENHDVIFDNTIHRSVHHVFLKRREKVVMKLYNEHKGKKPPNFNYQAALVSRFKAEMKQKNYGRPIKFNTRLGSPDITQSSSNSGCYIATMVYGDYEHPQVLVLREFRDNFLAQFLLGRLFIRFYYKFSPGWVKSLEHNKMINKSIKKALNAFIKIYKK